MTTKTEFDDGDWLAQRLDTLRPGWRGRLRLKAEEAHSDALSEIIGTVVEEPLLERDPVDDSVIDATVTLCANYRNERFTTTLGEPTLAIRASRIAGIEAM